MKDLLDRVAEKKGDLLDRVATEPKAPQLGPLVADLPEFHPPALAEPGEMPPYEERKPIGIKESLAEEFVRPAKGAQYVPGIGGIVGAAENLLHLDAAQRLSRDYDYNQPIRAEQLAPGAMGIRPARFTTRKKDVKLIEDLLLRLERQRQGYTFGGKVVKGVLNLPTWMAEFAMTGGLATLGSKAAQNVGVKLMGRYAKTKAGQLALRAAGWTGGAITRATLGLAPRIVEKATGRQVEVQILGTREEGWATSFAKAWGDVTIEAASETAGRAITAAPIALMRKSRLGTAFINKLQSGWMKATGGTKAAFLKKMLTRGGYSNIIGEMGEEWLGTILRAVTNVEDFGAGKDAGVGERLIVGLKEHARNVGVEAVVLSTPLAGQVVLGQAARLLPAEKPYEVREEDRRAEAVRRQREALQPDIRTEEEIARMDAELAEIQRPARKAPQPPPKPSDITPPAEVKEVTPPTEAEVVRAVPPIDEVIAPAEPEITEKPKVEKLLDEAQEEGVGISTQRRNRILRELATEIKESDIYQAELEGIEAKPIGPGFYYVPANLRGEVEDIIGKGRKTRLQKMFTFDRSETKIIKTPEGKAEIGPTPWDTAVQEALGRGKEGIAETAGVMDIADFVQQVKDSVEAGEDRYGLIQKALDNITQKEGDPYRQYRIAKFEMVRDGYSPEEVDDMTREWAEQYGLDEAEIENEFIGPEPLKIKEIKALPEDKRDAAIETLARENVLKQERLEAKRAVNEVLEENDIEAEVREVEEIKEEEVPFERRGRPVGAAIITPTGREIVQLAYGADSETGYHEAYHTLRRHLTKKDTNVLDKHFKGDEEAEARTFAEFAKTGKTRVGYLKAIWRKLVEKLRKIKSALQGRGYRNINDIFGEIQRGVVPKEGVRPSAVQYERGVFDQPIEEQMRLPFKERQAAIKKVVVQEVRQKTAKRKGKPYEEWRPKGVVPIKSKLIKAVDAEIARTMKPRSNSVNTTPEQIATKLGGLFGGAELFYNPGNPLPEVAEAFTQLVKGGPLIQFETTADKWRREAERSARVKAEKARLKAVMKPKKKKALGLRRKKIKVRPPGVPYWQAAVGPEGEVEFVKGPPGATKEQKARVNDLAIAKGMISKRGKLTPRYRKFAKVVTGKNNIDQMTQDEVEQLADMLDLLTVDYRGNARIPSPMDTINKEVLTELKAKLPELKTIGYLERFRPAWRVFQKMGLYHEVFEKAFEAEISSVEELFDFRKQAKQMQKLTGKDKVTSEKLFNALENPGSVKLSDNEKAVVVWAKKFFDDWADRLNLGPEARRKNYITHIFEADIAEQLKEKHPIDPDLIRALDFITPQTIFNPFLQKRLGKTTGLKRDLWAAMQAYENRAIKKFYYEPLIKRIRVYEKFLPPSSARYLRSYITRITGRPLVIDKEINQTLKEAGEQISKLPGGDKLAQYLTKGNASGMMAYNIAGIYYEAWLGLRPASAIKNLSQHGLALAETGPIAFSKAMKTIGKKRADLLAHSRVLRSRKSGYLPGIDQTFIKGLESKRRKIEMAMFRAADRKNVSDAFLAGYYEAKAKGLSDEWAYKRGDEVAAKTQYLYSKLAGSQATQSGIGRVLGVLTTWPENWAELMKDWVQGKPSEVYKDYEKETGQKVTPTNWAARRKSLWTYLSLVGTAALVEKGTPIKAMYYTGWTSIRSMQKILSGQLPGLELPATIALLAAGLLLGDKKLLKQAWNRIKRFWVIQKELRDIISGKKDWMNLFIYLEKKKDKKGWSEAP